MDNLHKKGGILITVICAVMVLIFSLLYASFTSRKIYETSCNHMQEVYSQANRTVSAVITQNWNLLGEWSGRINNAVNEGREADVATFINNQKEQWNLSGFYFLNDKGEYMTAEGNGGRFDFGTQTEPLIKEKKSIVANPSYPTGSDLVVFAVPVKKATYKGFEYTAMAVSCYNSDFEDILSIDSYRETAVSSVITPDGDVLFSTDSSVDASNNYFKYLEEHTVYIDEDISSISDSMQKCETGNVQMKMESDVYEMVYMPLEAYEWVLVGVIPNDVVISSMHQIQLITIFSFVFIFALVFVIVFILIVRRNKRNIIEKDKEIAYKEQMFEMISDCAEDIFIMFSPEDYKVEYVSPNVEELIGITEEEINADVRSLAKTTVPPGQNIAKEALVEIPIGKSISVMRTRKHEVTGEIYNYQETVYHDYVEGNEKYVLVMSDRTKELKIQDQLKQALDIAKSANEAKTFFLSSMSHDIRTPMNAIINFSKMLDRDAENPGKVREYVKKIVVSAQHLLSLINDVLDMSKIESGNSNMSVVDFNLADLVDEMNVVMRSQAKAKQQNFEIKIVNMFVEQLQGDYMHIKQILLNLLSNAVKYTPEGGNIEMTITALEWVSSNILKIRFEVKDDGIGMSPEYQKVIFEPFSRDTENDAVSHIQGTGLGMSITKNLVDLMSGDISVKSELGKGSTFTVDLDVFIAGWQEDADFWEDNDIHRILVVDDEPYICQDIESLMVSSGVQVTSVADISQAYEAMGKAELENKPYDLILFDWDDDAPDVIENASNFRKRVSRAIPVLAFSVDEWSEIDDRLDEADMDGFLPKPFFVSNLRQAIHKYVVTEFEEGERCDEETILAGKHFLVAEDNELNKEILEALLEMEGAECDFSENGQIALDKFIASEPGKYDMVLMDIQMPVMDGYTAAREIRACSHPEAKSIKIIAMTAEAFAEDVEQAFKCGMNAHTTKPIDIPALRKIIADLINND